MHRPVIDRDRIALGEKLLDLEQKIHLIKRANIRIYLELVDTLGDVPNQTLLAIEKHKPLLNRFLISDCKKYTKVSKAVVCMEQSEILIYLPELALYGVFSHSKYYSFITNLKDDMYNLEISYNPEQVIFSNFPQKIIFVCSNNSSEKIITCAKSYFKSDVSVSRDNMFSEVTILDEIVPNAECSKAEIGKFSQYLSDLMTQDEQSHNIYQPHMSILQNCEYFKTKLQDHINITEQQLRDILKSGFQLDISINTKITIKARPLKPEVKNSDTEWIANNPPGNMKTTEYYAKYLKGGGSLPQNVFGRYMKKSGYTKYHSGKDKYYVN
jgi:hypothetical protein